MTKKLPQACATDKEIYDLLMSGKQRVTTAVLRGLARKRGIFYSPRDSRDKLVENISGLLHDHRDVLEIVDKRESSQRGEKTTSITLDALLTQAEIKAAIADYKKDVQGTEVVTSSAQGGDVVNVNLEYDEFDYSKTRLLQKQTKEAEVSFVAKEGKTVIRMPATDKGRAVVQSLKKKIDAGRAVTVVAEAIELTDLKDADLRTRFFISLFSKMKDFKQTTVTSLKVAKGFSENTQAEIEFDDGQDEQDDKDAAMLSVVNDVALSGSNLTASPQYKQLRDGGFFITNMVWVAIRQIAPFDLVQFTAGFESAHEGTNFRYSVRIAPKLGSGEHAKNFRAATEGEKTILFDVIEKTSRSVLNDLRSAESASELADKVG